MTLGEGVLRHITGPASPVIPFLGSQAAAPSAMRSTGLSHFSFL